MAYQPHVLIVGAGIAGASAAFFAHERGARVTIIDAGQGTASHVPTALVNPVRGTSGKVVDGGFEATRFTFSLVEQLIARGHAIAHGRGLLRPVPNALTQQHFTSNLPIGVPHAWQDVGPLLGLKDHWHSALSLPESGWIASRALISALLRDSQATLLEARVRDINTDPERVTLEDGTVLGGDVLLWCGGAMGAALSSLDQPTFRPGSVMLLERALAPVAMSYGIYAAPSGAHGVVGSTSEPRSSVFSLSDNAPALQRLRQRVETMWADVSPTIGAFRGVRLEHALGASRITSLDGFGSRGFLLAPLAASNWAKSTL